MRWAAPLILGLLAVWPAAQAYTQDEAPTLDPRVERAWVEPANLQAGQQWQAFIRFKPDSNVSDVGYQACIVPGACIISPRQASQVDERTWGMNTADYTNPLNGKPYPWPAGHVGVKWFVAEGGLNYTDGEPLPRGLDLNDPACGNASSCLHTHYLTVPVAATGKGAPAPGLLLAALAVLVAGQLRRQCDTVGPKA